MDLETARKTSDLQARDPTLGKPDAPLTMHLFADFQCPHCRTLENSPEHKRLQEEHIEGGNVKLVFVPYPVLGEDSWTAAEAAHQVWRQAPEVYWAWHKAMFEAQGEENSGWASIDGIVRVSERFDAIDPNALRKALQDHDHRGEVERDVELARSWEAGGTPVMFLEGERIEPPKVNDQVRREVG